MKKEIFAMYASADKESCDAEGGRWEKGDGGACFLKAEDSVKLEKTAKANVLKAEITTLGTNAHMCMIDGNATLSKDGQSITLKQKGEDYNMETDSLDKVTCIVTAKLSKDGKTMNIRSNDKCKSFCGANAWFWADGLKKSK